MESFLTRPVESRVADFVLEIASRHGVPDARGTLVATKYTHHEMASYVGSTRETVTLILGELKRRGLIDIDRRRVVVRDFERLRALI
jgi:CRP-like cAMP-binding protein